MFCFNYDDYADSGGSGDSDDGDDDDGADDNKRSARMVRTAIMAALLTRKVSPVDIKHIKAKIFNESLVRYTGKTIEFTSSQL